MKLLLFVIFFIVTLVVGEECKTNTEVKSGDFFSNIFNHCLKDTSKDQWGGKYASRLHSFVNGDQFCMYISVLLLLLCSMATIKKNDEDIGEIRSKERASFIRLHCVLLFFRVSFSNSMDPWLYCCFKQQRPLGTHYGMPSGDAMVATVVGSHIFEVFSKPLGCLLVLCVMIERLMMGIHSLGQVTVGVCVGIIIHIYMTRTPIKFRLLDFMLNIIVGSTVLSIAKHSDKNVDYWWAIGFMQGAIWQCFALFLFYFYNWSCVGRIHSKTATGLLRLSFFDLTQENGTQDGCNVNEESALVHNMASSLDGKVLSIFDRKSSGGSFRVTLMALVVTYSALAATDVFTPHVNNFLKSL